MSRLLVTWGRRVAQAESALAPTQRPRGEEQSLHSAWDTAASESSSALALGPRRWERRLHRACDTVASEPSSALAPKPGRWGGPGEERRSLPPGT